MKTYKVWVEIEEYDDETEEHRDMSDSGEAEPVPVGTFDTLEEAINATLALEWCAE